MKRSITVIIFLMPVFCLGQAIGNLDNWLERNSVIEGFDSLFLSSKSKNLSALLQDKKIVAIGEPTHGSKEAQLIKLKLFKFLVYRTNFRTLALEAIDKTGAVNDYLLYGKGNAITASKSLGMWFFSSMETVELLSWMREFNKTHSDKVRLFGSDITYKFDVKSLKDSLININYTNSKLLDSISVINDKYLSKENLIPNKIARDLQLMVNELEAEILNNEAKISKKISPSYFDFLKYSLITYKQAIQGYVLGKSSPEYYRDSCMAANISYISKNFSSNGKVLYGAHNGHIQKAKNYRSLTTGMFLHQKYSSDFYTIGVQIGELKFKALGRSRLTDYWTESTYSTSGIIKNSFVSLLKDSKFESFFINFNTSDTSDQFNRLFKKSHPLLYVGWSFEPQNEKYYYDNKKLYELFDGIVYLNKSDAINIIINPQKNIK